MHIAQSTVFKYLENQTCLSDEKHFHGFAYQNDPLQTSREDVFQFTDLCRSFHISR